MGIIFLFKEGKMNYPLAVFIDTNIFISCKYDFSNGHLDLLRKFVINDKISVYISNVVKREVEKHLSDDTRSAYNKFKAARKEALNQIASGVFKDNPMEHWYNLPKKSEVIEATISKFNNYLDVIKVTILDNQGVVVDDILDAYFNETPPFEAREKKKNEFPDAFMISKLKIKFDEKKPIIVITEDKGFQQAFQSILGFNCLGSLGELYDFINRQDKIYDDITTYFSLLSVKEKISELIVREVEDDDIEIDGLDCDRKGYCEGFSYTETFIDKVSNVVVELSSIDDIDDESVTLSINCKLDIEATCLYEDYENAIWDSEDGVYLFVGTGQVEERHEPEFEVTLIISKNLVINNLPIEVDELSYYLSLDEYTRVAQDYIVQEDPREDAHAEMMEAMEEFYKH
jgi:rRNA-processing protein FCF1